MKIEVDFPTNGLPDDVELVSVAYLIPAVGRYFFDGNAWHKVRILFHNPVLTAITKPKEVWLPCTPEDAFAKMLYPDSRVIRKQYDQEIVQTVISLGNIGVCLSTGGLPHNATYQQLEVLKTKELDK